MTRLERTDQLLLIAFLAVIAFPLLYAGRALDNNTLTSWQWVFRQGGVIEIFLLVAAVTIAALPLSGIGMEPRLHTGILFLAALLAVMPLWGAPELIVDTSRYIFRRSISNARDRFLHQGVGSGNSAWTDLPVVPFVYGVIFRYLGESRMVIQVFTTLLFASPSV